MKQIKRGRGLSRRGVLRGAAALGLAGVAAPALAQARTLTVSTWAGAIPDIIKAHLLPEFEKRTGARLAYDIGGQGARYNKLLAQRVNPPADIFLASDEAVVAGHRAGVLAPARRAHLPSLAQVHDWALTVNEANPDGMIAGVPSP
ncbi:MAG: hypothetical protein WDO24_05680 [Pseudomonadota bacterium]